MSIVFSRRRVLRGAGAAAAMALVGRAGRGQTAPRAVVIETKPISRQPTLYHGWPTVARRRNGQLLVAYSGGREGHVCPFGRVELIHSDDDGRTWSEPRVLADSPIDNRDAGVLETAQGTLLVTSFTSLAYESILAQAEQAKPGQPGAWPAERLKRWQAAHQRLDAAGRRAKLGVWMLRSTDGGRTWSEPYDCLVNSPHGPITLADGRVLYAGKDLWRPGERVGVCQSTDDGATWRWLAQLPVRPGDRPAEYHELHAVEVSAGRLLVQLRNHNPANAGETLQSESTDGGKTWTLPHPIGVWGVPSHLLRLRDGRLLMTYGHRRPPLGNQARTSEDGGRTWSPPMILSADGTSTDLGYPSTAQLADGSLVSVWYELLAGSPRAVLRQARWSL
ncbi:MAG: sialidase family protein [Thermoguttaceae bacterium]